LFLLKTFKALNGLLCADVPLRNYSLTHNRIQIYSAHYSLSVIDWLIMNWLIVKCQLCCQQDLSARFRNLELVSRQQKQQCEYNYATLLSYGFHITTHHYVVSQAAW